MNPALQPLPLAALLAAARKHARPILGAALLAGAGAAQAGPYQLLLEADADGSAGSELYLATYDSQADLLSGTLSAGTFSQINVNSAFSVHGFTYDGSAYNLLLETDDDLGSGSEVFLARYASIGDLLNGTLDSGAFSQINVNSAYDIAGFTFDGNAYQLLLESIVDGSAGSELYLATYDSQADLLAGTLSAGTFSQINVNSVFGVHGFSFADGAYQLLLETNADNSLGNELFLATYGSIADLLTGTLTSGSFSQINVNANFSVAGLDAFLPGTPDPDPDPNPDPDPVPVPAPQLGLLLVGMAFLSRRRSLSRPA